MKFILIRSIFWKSGDVRSESVVCLSDRCQIDSWCSRLLPMPDQNSSNHVGIFNSLDGTFLFDQKPWIRGQLIHKESGDVKLDPDDIHARGIKFHSTGQVYIPTTDPSGLPRWAVEPGTLYVISEHEFGEEITPVNQLGVR